MNNTKSGPFKLLPLVLICSIALAVIIAFGNPTLWSLTTETNSGFVSQDRSRDGAQELGSFMASSLDESPERMAFLESYAAAINEQVIAPDETFSFAQFVDEDMANQLTELYANVEVSPNGDPRDGISQVATALYVAALRSDLEIVERYAHTWLPDYTPPGLDAIYRLSIKNTTGYPISIGAYIEGNAVEVVLWGDPAVQAVQIDVASDVVEQIPAPTPQDELATQHTVESYRLYHLSEEESDRVLVALDTYLVSGS